jgi:hypothetical protein
MKLIIDGMKIEHMMLPMRSNNIESAHKDPMVDAFNRKYKSNLPKQVGFPTIFKLTKFVIIK